MTEITLRPFAPPFIPKMDGPGQNKVCRGLFNCIFIFPNEEYNTKSTKWQE